MSKKRKKQGYAKTKNHKGHPALYNKTGLDNIEYLVITHSANVKDKNKIIETIPLSDSISPKEREKNKKLPKSKRKISHVLPIVYEGQRSVLGKEVKGLSPLEKDKNKLNALMNTLPRQKAPVKKENNKKRKKK